MCKSRISTAQSLPGSMNTIESDMSEYVLHDMKKAYRSSKMPKLVQRIASKPEKQNIIIRMTKIQIQNLKVYFDSDPDWTLATQIRASIDLKISLKKIYKWGIDHKKKVKRGLVSKFMQDQPKLEEYLSQDVHIDDFTKEVDDLITMEETPMAYFSQKGPQQRLPSPKKYIGWNEDLTSQDSNAPDSDHVLSSPKYFEQEYEKARQQLYYQSASLDEVLQVGDCIFGASKDVNFSMCNAASE